MNNQKITFKRQRPIALITILIMILNLITPYTVVFADGGSSSAKTLIAEVDQSSDAEFLFDDFQVICVTLSLQGNYDYTGVDLSFQYDPDILTPYYQSMTKVGRNWVENYFEADNMSEWAIGDADLSSSFSENNTYLFKDEARFTLEGTLGSVHNPQTDGEPYTVATMYFKVADGYTPSTIPATAFGLKPITRLSKGMEMSYKLASGGQTIVDEGFGYEGFEESSKEIDTIAVKTPPTKTSYEWGDAINLAGGELTVTYTDGTSEDISMTATGVGIMSGDPANTTFNPPEVTVSYGGKTATFNITVTDPVVSLAVTTPMSKFEYSHDDPLNFSGLVLTATKKSGATQTLSATSPGVTISDSVASINAANFTQTSPAGQVPVSGDQKITYTYEGKTASQTILVNDEITSIDLVSQPTKTVYKIKESLDLTGAQVRVNLKSGNPSKILNASDGSITISTYNKNLTGTVQHLSVAMGDKTAADTINVEAYNYIRDIIVTSPSDRTPMYNTELNLSGSSITEQWADNTMSNKGQIQAGMISGYNKTRTGSQTVTVTYPVTYTLSDGVTTIPQTFTKTFTVNVINPPDTITITPPTKTVYNHGDTLALSTGTILVTYIDTTTKNVPIIASMVKEGSNAVDMSPTNYDSTNKVNKTLTIKYIEDGVSGTASYPITIVNDVKSITVSQMPKQTYNVNETLDLDNGEITVTRAYGTPEVISMQDPRVNVTGLNTSAPATNQPLTVEFTENDITKSTSYNINVVDSVTGITINNPPTVAKYGQSLDLSSTTIDVTKGSGTTPGVPASSATISGYDPNTLGTQTVTLEYAGQTDTFNVEVKDYVTKITLNPNSVSAIKGTALATVLSDNNVEYTVHYAKAGADTPVALPVTMITSSYSQTASSQNVTAEYTDTNPNSATNGQPFYATLTIALSNDVTAVDLTAPTKTTYKHGEALDISTAVVDLTFEDTTHGNGNVADIVVTELDGTTPVSMTPALSDYTDNKCSKTVLLKYTDTATGIANTVNYTFDIVNDVQSITMHTTPKDEYNIGDSLDITGGEILVTRALGTPEVISMGDSRVNVSGFASSAVNAALPITVEFTENGVTKGTSYNVKIEDNVTGIAIKTTPKQNYKYNESLDVSTGIITVTRGSGSVDIPMTAAMITEADGSAFDPQTLGTRNLTVTYEGQTAEYEVTVKDYVTGIAVSPNPASGTLGDTLASLISANSIEYTVTYAKAGAGSPTALAESMVTTAYSASATTQSLTVEYVDNDRDSATNGQTFSDTLTVNLSNEVTGVSISSLPTKATYNHGDSIDLTGAVVTLTYADTTTGTGNVSDIVVTETDGSALNMSPAATDYTNNKLTKTVNLTYTLASDASLTDTKQYTFDIINDVQGITIQTTPKTSYNVNDPLDITGGEILVTRATGTPEVISMSDPNVTVDGFDSTIENTNLPLTVKYTENGIEKQITYNVSVQDSVTAVAIKTTPKQNYKYNEPLDVTGGEIEITKGSGTQTIPMTTSMITEADGSAFDPQTLETRNLTVTYGGQTATYEVTVKDYVTGIKVNPDTVTGDYNDELSDVITDSSIKFVVTYAKAGDQSPIALTDAMVTTTYDKQDTNEQTLTVKYTDNDPDSATNGDDFTADFKVTLVDAISAVVIETTPKTDYKYGDSLDVTAGTIKVTQTSGEHIIPMTSDMVTEEDGTPFDSTKLGTRNLKVKYGDEEMTYEITVSDFVTGIILTPPTKDVYDYNEPIDLTGGSVQKVMASGTTTPVVPLTDSDVQVSGYDPTTVGAQTITVEYEGETKTFGVYVNDGVTSIEINPEPAKTSYLYGDALDVTGGKIIVTYASANSETINITPSMVSGFDSTVLGNQTLTVTYKGMTDTYNVNVEDYVDDIEIVAPYKLTYAIGESLDLTGATVNTVMASGAATTPVAITPAMVSGFNSSSEGVKTITVTYEGKTKTFAVTVSDEMTGWTVKSVPNKLTYRYGESLDLTGSELEVTKESGATEIVSVTSNMVSGYTPYTLGTQTLTVTYEGETKEFTQVTVEDYIKKLNVKTPTKTTYHYGEDINLDGGTVSIIMASGATAETAEMTGAMISGYNSTNPGTQTINVEYKGLTGSFTVKVVDEVKGISINTTPNKTVYEQGEGLDVTGGTIRVVRDSGVYTIPMSQTAVTGYNPNTPGSQTVTVTYEGQSTTFVVVVNKKQEEEKPQTTPESTTPRRSSSGGTRVVYVNTATNTNTNNNPEPKAEVPTETPKTEQPKDEVKKEQPKQEQKNNNDKPIKTLGVKDEKENKPDDGNKKKYILGGIIGLAILLLLLLLILKRNVKVYVQEDAKEEKFVLGGLDKIKKNNPELDIDKFLDKDTYPNKVKVVLDDSISEKLDGKEIEIKHRGQKIKIKVKYEDKPFEFILD